MSYYFGIRVGSNYNAIDDTHNLSHIYFVYFFTFCSILYDVARWACTFLLSPYKCMLFVDFISPNNMVYTLLFAMFCQYFFSNNFDAFETMYF